MAGGRFWRAVRRIAVLVARAIAFFPIYWLVSTSFKPHEEWTSSPPVWLTSQPTLQNYRIVFFPEAARRFAARESGSLDYKVSGSAWKAFGDSAVIATLATLFSVVFGTPATRPAATTIRSSSSPSACSRRSPSWCRWWCCSRCSS